MHKKSSKVDVNVLPFHLVLYLILLYLIVNPKSVFANGKLSENFLVNGKNEKGETRLCNPESFTISIASPDSLPSTDPDKIEPYFQYLQILRMILFDIEHNEEDMTEFLHQYYANNQTILKIVNELEQDYHQHSPIWWYTRECFLSSLINQALQTMDMKILIKMGLFLRDLCQQIENFHSQKSNSSDSLTVYRCLKLAIKNFEKLQQNNDVYMSFNSFLLTNFDQEFENEVCSKSQVDNEILPVLIEIKIDGKTSKFTPFVWLNYSNSEKGILFSMNSVFHVTNIRKNQRNIWQVQMVGINDSDYSLGFSIALMHLGISKKNGWDKLGHMMILVGQPKHAENLYKVLLELADVDDKREIIHLYDNLGTIKFENGSYEEAHFFLEKKLQIQENFFVPDQLDLASTYTMIGVINSKMGKFENALSFHGKALEIRENVLPSNHRDVAITYDNIAIVHSKMGNHFIALSLYQEALEIFEEILPFYDPDRATNYDNIAAEYKFIGEYGKALWFFKKALQIREVILSKDDPVLAFTYDNIGGVYQNMKQYDTALLFYEKSLKISEKVLHSNHPELAVTYNNIANLKFHTGDYVNALLFCEKALEIQKASLPQYHFGFVIIYKQLGEIYYQTGKYSTALSYFERGLEIGEVSLPENHEQLKILRQYIVRIEKEL